MGTPRSLFDFVRAPKPVYGPPSPNAPPPSDLPTSLTALIDLVRGATVGAGDDPSATPNRWLRGGELLSAVPLGSLRSLTGLVKGGTPGGFFSRVDDAVARLLPAKGAHPNKVASLLKSNASAEELAYRKVPEFLAAQGNATVTPAQLQAHLAAHPAPVPTVKTLAVTPQDAFVKSIQLEFGIPPPATPEGWTSLAQRFERGAQQWQRNGDPAQAERMFRLSEQATEMAEGLDLGRGLGAGQPKYAQYQLPGGEAYRETLLTLPEPGGLPAGWRTGPSATDPGQIGVFNAAGDQVTRAATAEAAIQQAQSYATGSGRFRSGHFDEPNLLVHTRANERVLPTGERGRFVEEVQSDWHQQGKQKGYQGGPPNPADPYAAEFGEHPHAVPDAPFKDTWPDLGLKQQLLETAADPQASWLGFTSGQTQAARYDLSKQVSRVRYDPQTHYLEAFDHGGDRVIKQEGVRPEQLPDYIGKEPAEKLLAQPTLEDAADQTAYHTLSGVDLQVGGEGMRHFYDQVLPKRLEKILKPFGGTVERGAVPTSTLSSVQVPAFTVRDQNGNIRGVWEQRAEAEAYLRNPPAFIDPARSEIIPTTTLAERPVEPKMEPAWLARLTPEMKARILKEGLPLMTLPLAAWVASQEPPPSDAELFSLSRFAQRPRQREAR